MKFLGIPMEGTAKEFCEKLKSKGFTLNGYEGRWTVMKGKYEKIEECYVAACNGRSKNVGEVMVMLPVKREWTPLEADYTAMKKKLLKKYGKPHDDHQDFNSMWSLWGPPKTDREKYRSLRMGNCLYRTLWNTDEGQVLLGMDSSGRVTITFTDKQNVQAPKKESHMKAKDLYTL